MSKESFESTEWTLSKADLQKIVVEEAEKIVDKWKSAAPGDLLSDRQVMDGIHCKISRSEKDDSVLFNIFLRGEKHDCAQMELRKMSASEWNIADRQVNKEEHKGKGILKAFVKAAERFVELHAASEKEPTEHRVFLRVAQPNVFQVFEHLGYQVRTEDELDARFLRSPGNFPEVIVQRAWTHGRTSSERLEMINIDPYCFKKENLVDNPHPLPREAIRVTLQKFIKPKGATTDQVMDGVRVKAQEIL